MTHATTSRLIVPGTDPDVAAAYAALAGRAREESFGFEDEIAFVDVETTGFDPHRHRPIEVAAVIARGPEVLERFTTLVDPGVPIPREITHLTGITDEMVIGAPSPEEAVARLAEVVAGRDIVAHNVGFDEGFLQAEASRTGVAFTGAWLDSLELARIALPRLRSHRLADIAVAFGLAPAEHRALPDAEAVFGLWRIGLCALLDLPADVVARAAALAKEQAWPLRTILAHVAAGRPSGSADLRALREARVRKRLRVELADAWEVDLDARDAVSVAVEFSAGGAVSRMYESYETRQEQVHMSEAVATALAEGRHAAVEAGTGVGKSVAYLVPAIRFACANGVTVGVSTKTNALTDQLVYLELPALSRELAEEFEFVALKGYSHYVCLRKLDRYLSATEDGGRSPATAATLLSWVAQTGWGDSDGLNLHWSSELRAAVTASAQECTKKRCRFFPDLCYLHGLRRRAACANVVVTNHALLFSNVTSEGGILPPIRHWIVDEAHSAEEVARDQLSVGVDCQALTSLLRALAARRGTALAGLEAAADSLGDEGGVQEALEAAVSAREEADTALTIAHSFFEYLKELPGSDSSYDRVEVRVTERTRGGSTWGHVASTGASLARHLAALLDHGTRLLVALEEGGVRPVDDRADLTGQLAGVASQLTGLSTVLDGTDAAYVYSATADRRPDVAVECLDARVIDVGAVLAERFFPEVRTAIFTSATIATGDDFSHFARSIGLDRLPPESFETLRLPSSYDFERQMAAYVTGDAPQPKNVDYLPRMADVLFDIHVAMGGSVLTLFTNRRDLEALYDTVGPRLEAEGLRLVGQVRGESTKRVRDEFVGDERSSLFATRSFWEGFDAKGETLRCVIVVRLPFAHPGDPLLEELRERDPDGWWSDHYLPRALLELKQAAGRLIRSSTDEGCLVIADSRVVSGRQYGRRFLDALPVSSVHIATTAEVADEIARRFGRSS